MQGKELPGACVSLKVLSLLILIFFISTKSVAAELYNRHVSTRALGMGNAYLGVARGLEATFYNPAGLAETKGFNLTLLKVRAGLNDVDAITDLMDLADSDNFEDVLREFYGRPLNMSAGGYTGLVISGFAFAAYDSFNISADLSNPALPDFQLDYVNDFGFAAGFGFDLIPNAFSVGFVGKRIQRLGASETVSVDTLATLETDELTALLENEGIGYALDVGFNFTLPSPIKPTFAFVMRDVGDTNFSHDDGAKAPPDDEAEMLAGVSFELSIPGITITPALDYRYIDNADIHIGKKINFGLEVSLPIIDIRGGFHQGYWTAGGSFNMGLIQIDAATYGVELGEYPGQNEDRRYMVELTLDFGWDASSGSKIFGVDRETRRKLKQRR